MHLLKLSIILECEDCEWDSNYGNHRSVIFFFRLVSRTQGRDFEIKIERKSGEVHPERFDNWVQKKKNKARNWVRRILLAVSDFILPWISGSLLPRFPASFKSYGQDGKKPSFRNALFYNMYAHFVFVTATFWKILKVFSLPSSVSATRHQRLSPQYKEVRVRDLERV